MHVTYGYDFCDGYVVCNHRSWQSSLLFSQRIFEPQRVAGGRGDRRVAFRPFVGVASLTTYGLDPVHLSICVIFWGRNNASGTICIVVDLQPFVLPRQGMPRVSNPACAGDTDKPLTLVAMPIHALWRRELEPARLRRLPLRDCAFRYLELPFASSVEQDSRSN